MSIFVEEIRCFRSSPALLDPKGKVIRRGLCRNVVIQRIGVIRRVLRWAVSEQLIPPAVLRGLQTVQGLKRGRTDARETAPIMPVNDATVDATLPFLPPVVVDMVRLQRLIGCRPGEVCMVRPCDVDTSGDVWVYRPESHKTEHCGRERRIFIGPKAQDVLPPYLLRDKQAFCFSPEESDRRRKAEMRARRQSRVQPSQVDRSKRGAKRRPRDSNDKNGYATAVRRASTKTGGERWTPNRLRHKLWLHTFPEYNKPLGPPQGPAEKDGYQYTREFEHASVWLDIDAGQGMVTWK